MERGWLARYLKVSSTSFFFLACFIQMISLTSSFQAAVFPCALFYLKASGLEKRSAFHLTFQDRRAPDCYSSSMMWYKMQIVRCSPAVNTTQANLDRSKVASGIARPKGAPRLYPCPTWPALTGGATAPCPSLSPFAPATLNRAKCDKLAFLFRSSP